MDARSFAHFLSNRLIDTVKPIEQALLNGHFKDDTTASHQAVGKRVGFLSVVQSLEALLNEFVENGGNAVAQPSPVVLEAKEETAEGK